MKDARDLRQGPESNFMDYLSKQRFQSSEKMAGVVPWARRDEGGPTLGREFKHRDQTSHISSNSVAKDTNKKQPSTR